MLPRLESVLSDLASGLNQRAKDRAFADCTGVVGDIGRGGRDIGQVGQVGRASGLFKAPLSFQVFAYRHNIRGTILLNELPDGFEDELVVVAIEVLPSEEIRYPVPGHFIEE